MHRYPPVFGIIWTRVCVGFALNLHTDPGAGRPRVQRPTHNLGSAIVHESVLEQVGSVILEKCCVLSRFWGVSFGFGAHARAQSLGVMSIGRAPMSLKHISRKKEKQHHMARIERVHGITRCYMLQHWMCVSALCCVCCVCI